MSTIYGNIKVTNNDSSKNMISTIYQDDLLMKIIYYCKKSTPKNFYFFFLFFLLKVLGIIILSHNYNRTNTNTDFSLGIFLRIFTFFGELKITNSNSFIINYDYLSLGIFIFISAPLLILFFIYKFLFKKKLKFLKLSKKFKIIIKFCGILLVMVVFLSQHLLEILTFIFFNLFSANYLNTLISTKNESSSIIKDSYIPYFLNFENNLSLGKYTIIILNSISIIIINLTLNYYFVFINEPYLNSKASIKLYHNKTYLIFIIISFNLQSLHYIQFIFKETAEFNFKIIIIILNLIISGYLLFDNILNYNFQVFFNKFLDFVYSLSFISCVLDLIIYYSYSQGLDSSQNIFKLCIELILSFILNFFVSKMKLKSNLQILKKNLFSKNKKISMNSLFIFTDFIQNSIGNSINFLPIFTMIDSHTAKCYEEDCTCKKYNFKNFLKNFDVNREIKFLKDEDKLISFKKLNNEIITLGENEIVNTIYQYYKGKEINKNYNLFLLHIDYIFHFKRNYLFSNYLIEQYFLSIKNLPFVYKFYFFIYKKSLIKQHNDQIKNKSSMNTNLNFLDFYKYFKIIKKIKKLISKNCKNFENLIYFKKIFDNNKLTTDNQDTTMNLAYKKNFDNIENIFNICDSLNKQYKKLCNYLEINFKTERLRNIELSYILFNFFILINKEIPFEMRSLFLQIDSYSTVDSYTSSYREKKITHPIIINVNKTDTFLIRYISQKLCDLIEYKKNQLTNQDIHILLPQIFLEQHKTIMKKLIFLENDSKISKETFLVTKNLYYYAVQITSSFLPTINQNTLLIMDVFPIVENPNSKIKSYKFILDLNSKFITYTKNFVDNYMINLTMFNKLKINFAQFFNINMPQVIEKFKPAIDYIQKIDLKSTNNIMKIFHHVDLGKALEYVNEENKVSTNYNLKNTKLTKTLDFVKKKEKLLPTLIKIKKKIQESEMDIEYLQKINEIEKKFYRHTSTSRMIHMRKVISKSLGITENNANFCTPVFGGIGVDQFYIKFNICNIGNIPYFSVQLYEQNEENFDLVQLRNLQLSFGLHNLPTNTITIGCESNKTITDIFKLDIPLNTITDSKKDSNKYIDNSTNPIITMNTLNNIISHNTLMNTNYVEVNTNSHNINIMGMNTNKENLDNFNASANQTNFTANNQINLNLSNLNSSQLNFNTNFLNINNSSTNDSVDQLINLNKDRNNNFYNKNFSSHTVIAGKKIKDFSILKKIYSENSISNKKNIISKRAKEKTIFFILFILLFIQIFLSFFSFFFKNEISNFSFQLFNLNYYGLLTKLSIYYTSSTVITTCTNIDIDPKQIDKFNINIYDYIDKFKIRSDKLIVYLYKFMNFITISEDQTQTNEILNIISQSQNFKLLYADWSSYSRKSNILDEISYYHYYIAGLKQENTFKECRVKDFFYYEKFNSNNSQNNFISPAKNEEMVLYYIVYNLFQVFREKFELISLKINEQLIDYHNKSQITLIIFNLVILFFAFALIIIIIFSIRNYKRKIVNIIFTVFLKDKIDKNFEDRLSNFKTITIDFDKSICIEYEENYKKLILDEVEQKETLKVSKKESSNKGKNSKGNKTNNFNLHKEKAKENNSFARKITNPNKNENEKSQENNRQQNLEIVDIKMKIIKYSYLVLFVALFCYLTLGISNIMINIREYKKLILANQISVNFLDRLPKFSELVLYYKISVIFNNTDFILTKREDYDNKLYSNYFGVNYDTTSDNIYRELNQSEYVHILYNLKIIRKNIDLFMSSNDPMYNQVLPLLREYESKMNTPDFCVFTSENYVNLNYNYENITEYFHYLNKEAAQCMGIGNGMNKYGLNIAVDSLVANTNNLYLDFFRAKDSRNITKTLTDIGFLRTVLNVENTFQKTNMNYLPIILEEMTSLYSSLKNIEYIYSSIGLIFNLSFISYVIFGVIKKLQRYYISLVTAIDKFKVALVSSNNINNDLNNF